MRERLIPLHARARKPRPGDWLHDHPERGQTFDEYLRSEPTVPTEERKTIVVAPLGTLPESSARIVQLTTEYLALHFGVPTRLGAAIELEPPPTAMRKKEGSTQILTRWLLERVLPKKLPKDAAALVGFTTFDLWPGGNWNFVFGEATLNDRVGVWSLHRFGDPDAGPEAFRQTLGRTLKTAVHETGHMFSLLHCTQYACVQAGTNSLEESDETPLWLCPECLAKIAWATSTDPRDRLRETSAFCKSHGLVEEAAFLDRSLVAIA